MKITNAASKQISRYMFYTSCFTPPYVMSSVNFFLKFLVHLNIFHLTSDFEEHFPSRFEHFIYSETV